MHSYQRWCKISVFEKIGQKRVSEKKIVHLFFWAVKVYFIVAG